jgi:predicted nucleic acid-binding protein
VRTAVDSSVLLDVFSGDPRFGEPSSRALREAYDQGALIACEVVLAEVRACFPSDERFASDMDRLGISFEAISRESATLAGSLWRAWTRAGNERGRRIAPDFLVGAHALRHADRLLTRDRGFYRASFRGLTIVDPSE